MTEPLHTHRLLTATMTVVALLGWGTYAYSTHSSATRDQDRLEAIARITTERDALHSEHQRLVSGQLKLVSEQQRVQGELALANTQLAAAREEIALLAPQRNVAKKGDMGAMQPGAPSRKAVQKHASEEKARSKVAQR
jgi:hypothetical protein